MGCLETFQGNTNDAKHPRYVTKYGQSRRNPKMSQKQPKLKVIIHAFGVSLGLSYGRHEMPLRDMGVH